jgi:hypothetical protein
MVSRKKKFFKSKKYSRKIKGGLVEQQGGAGFDAVTDDELFRHPEYRKLIDHMKTLDLNENNAYAYAHHLQQQHGPDFMHTPGTLNPQALRNHSHFSDLRRSSSMGTENIQQTTMELQQELRTLISQISERMTMSQGGYSHGMHRTTGVAGV